MAADPFQNPQTNPLTGTFVCGSQVHPECLAGDRSVSTLQTRPPGGSVTSYVMWAPFVSTYTAYSDVLAVMKRRLRLLPPKQTFEQISGSRI